MRKYYIADSGDREMMTKGIEVDKIFDHKELSKKDPTKVFGGKPYWRTTTETPATSS